MDAGLELLDRVGYCVASYEKVHFGELPHSVVEKDLVCPHRNDEGLKVHLLVSEDTSQLLQTERANQSLVGLRV